MSIIHISNAASQMISSTSLGSIKGKAMVGRTEIGDDGRERQPKFAEEYFRATTRILIWSAFFSVLAAIVYQSEAPPAKGPQRSDPS